MWPWRTIFFAIHVAACFAFIVTVGFWVVDVSAGRVSVLTVCAGLVMASPAIAVMMAEWLLFAKGYRKLETLLGIVAGLAGFMACFAFIANGVEAIVNGRSPGIGFWLLFGFVSLAMGAYGFWCCWLRVRHKTCIEPRGFPVDTTNETEMMKAKR